MTLYASYYDQCDGNTYDIEGDDVEDIANQLPEGYSGCALRVTDEAGWTRGWIRGRGAWTATPR